MKKVTEYIGSQFGNPRGLIGTICCFLMNIINRAMYRSIVACIKSNDSAKILDIGYGNGYLIEQLYRKSGAVIYGIDISDDMLKAAYERNKKAVDEKKINLSIGDCCNLKFPDNMFDIITSVNTIYFWNDTVKGLSEIRRTLKDGGVFYNLVYSKEWLKKFSYTKKGFRFFEKEEYKELGKKAGFSDITIKEVVVGKSYLLRYSK